MNRLSKRLIATTLGGAALILSLFSNAQVAVEFSPATVNMNIGESTLVEVQVTGVATPGVAALQLRLSFVSALVILSDPNAGFTQVEPFAPLGGDPLCATIRGTPGCDDPNWLLTSTGRTAVTGAASVDVIGGEALLLTGTQNEAAAPTGAGTIALIRLTATGNGSDFVSLSQSILADGARPPAAISHSTANLIVNVGPIVDGDGDGVADGIDNCTDVPNANQRDTDGDGYGNICDADLNNDGIVNTIDLGLFRSAFFTSDPDADFNGDGIVNTVDLGRLRIGFFLPPGPSGIAP